MENKNVWLKYQPEDLEKLEAVNASYREFMNTAKTERECVTEIIRQAEAAGYKNLDDTTSLKPGDKVYAVWMKKTICLFHIGTDDFENGMNILGAHIDSPRIDVKANPLYEDHSLAYLDTHYYGGIKKYQWVTLPLAIHGVVAKKDGTVVTIAIGEKDTDPVFIVTDLLIHLAAKQMEKKASIVIEGENLDLLIGSKPLKGQEKNAVVAQILGILKENYDIEEEDFLSAELEIVPAGRARECGLDRSMIMAYGQDDRICAYTSLAAMLDENDVKRTSCCLLVDKEEIGSVGATGTQSRFFENAVAEVYARLGGYSELKLRRALSRCTMLSSDVSIGYDPMYAEVFTERSSSFVGKGPAFSKHTGKGGKSGSNDANAEYISKIRKVYEDNNVSFQLSELGKVDVGGGGTIAFISAAYCMEVIDCGVAILCMHAPWEVSSKADVYETYRGYRAFLRDMTH